MKKKASFYSQEIYNQVLDSNKQIVDKFLRHKAVGHKTTATLKQYEMVLKNWLCFNYLYGDNKDILDMDDEDIEHYMATCMDAGNNKNTIRNKLATISSLFIYCKRKKFTKENPVEIIERPHGKEVVTQQNFLSEEQVDRCRELLKENIENAKTIEEIDKALESQLFFNLGLRTGGRLSALLSIKIEQIDFSSQLIIGVREKEGYVVDFIINERIVDLINNLLIFRKENDIESEYLFKYSKYIHRRRLQSIGAAVGIENLHPHDLRHTAANLLKKKGLPLEDVSSFLNHNGTDVTLEHYIDKHDEEKINRIRQIDI